jgi:hypothetical protein
MLRFAIVVVLSVVWAPCARAQGHDWEFALALYGWLPTISGELAYSVPGIGDEIVVDADTLLDNLEFTAMAAFTAHHGRWSITADGIFLAEAAQGSARLGPGPGLQYDAELEIDVWIAGVSGAYQLADTTACTLHLFAGARYLAADATFFLRTPGPGSDVGVDTSATIWNGVIGLRGRIVLSKHWYVPYFLDVGAGDSDLTWQIQSGVGYEFEWGSLVLAYRHLAFDQGGGGWLRDLDLTGAELGVVVRF